MPLEETTILFKGEHNQVEKWTNPPVRAHLKTQDNQIETGIQTIGISKFIKSCMGPRFNQRGWGRKVVYGGEVVLVDR